MECWKVFKQNEDLVQLKYPYVSRRVIASVINTAVQFMFINVGIKHLYLFQVRESSYSFSKELCTLFSQLFDRKVDDARNPSWDEILVALMHG